MNKLCSLIFVFMLIYACSESNNDVELENEDTSTDVTIPLSLFQKIYKTTSEIYIEDGFVYINTNGVPDHKSPYFLGTKWETEQYEAYDGSNPFVSNFNLNPNRVSELNIRFKIPVSPKKSSSNNTTQMGPIGVSLNGVPFYNQYAGMNQPLTREINSFDQYNGHPAPLSPGSENNASGRYHYHMEPFWITQNKGKDALIGFLLDGFPVYGPVESGVTIQSSDLDAYHGHSHSTNDFPDGIYHYHATADDPYINGSGYYGNPGTVSN